MISGFFLSTLEMQKLRIFNCESNCSTKAASKYGETQQTETTQKELIGYKADFFRSKKNNSQCGCFDCVECSFTLCQDCQKCSCRYCKSLIAIGYPDLSDPTHYKSMFSFTCKCSFSDTFCKCKISAIQSNYVSGYYLKYDLKLCYTGHDFCIFYRLDKEILYLSDDFNEFVKKVNLLQSETAFEASFQIRIL